MSLTTHLEEHITILEWKGPLGVDNHSIFKDEIQLLLNDNRTVFIFDLSKVNFIDSTGLGVMTSLLRNLKQIKGELVLAGLQDNVKSIFEITGLKKLFTIMPTVAAARAQLGG